MKAKQSNNLLNKLSRIKEEFDIIGNPESRSALLKSLDDTISVLSRLRRELDNPSFRAVALEIQQPLTELVRFFDRAKNDENLQALIALAGVDLNAKPKRQPIEIPSNLSNEQIRDLLRKNLTRSELKAIAMQRSISVSEMNLADIKQTILKNLERQEGYGRLATS